MGAVTDAATTLSRRLRPLCRIKPEKKIDAMQVKETVADGLKHEFQISVPAADIEAKVDARLFDMKDKVRLNGFRPGKVPVGHLKRLYGRSVAAETIEQLIRETNTEIFSERGYKLETEPKVTMPTEQKEVEDMQPVRSQLHGCGGGRAGDPARRFQEFCRREAGCGSDRGRH